MKVFAIKDSFGIDALQLSERADPTPSHGQVVVRVKAVSLNYRDLLTVKHGGMRNLRLPLVPCSDGAGEVVKIGPGVTRVKPGDRVFPFTQTREALKLMESAAHFGKIVIAL